MRYNQRGFHLIKDQGNQRTDELVKEGSELSFRESVPVFWINKSSVRHAIINRCINAKLIGNR